ncbi:MAG: DUF4399 domain-containing protein [Gammaproteobacteria bacterium]|nr:DUF4399 domain-containing protein [Gammaproteobacteria bacterium]
MKFIRFAIISLLLFSFNAYAGDTSAPDGAGVYIVSPAHGENVTTPFKVVFGLSGMGVAPAGIDKAKTGHHHLLIDTAVPDLASPVPSDANHRHFGGGQTEVVIELPPGRHTLQLLLADFAHAPHTPAVISEQITITVK